MEYIIPLAPYILSGLFGLLTVVVGIKWRRLKNVIREISNAWEDDKITPEEFDKIMKAFIGEDNT